MMSSSRINDEVKSSPKSRSSGQRQNHGSVTSSSPSLPSSPHYKPITPTKPLPRPTVIAASDDEDDLSSDSDGSLEDLSTILGVGPTRGQIVAKDGGNIYSTPRAKRVALGFHASPLTIMPKTKHKFDMSALEKAARLDDAVFASSVQAKADAEEMERGSKTKVDGDSDDDDGDDALVDAVTERAGGDAHKVLRAVRRVELGSSQMRYCFFDSEYTVPPSNSPPKNIKGPWRIMTQGNIIVREQNVISGMPQTLLRTVGQLPDSLFEWMLGEICIQSSAVLRLEYTNLVCESLLQIERLLTPKKLDKLFLRLGASQELLVKDAKLSVVKASHEPYGDREWSCLAMFLSLLTRIAPYLTVTAVTHTAQVLLRMSMDALLLRSPDLLIAYQDAISALLASIPDPSWDTFCSETCTLLHTLFDSPCIRTNALLCLPVGNGHAHNLKRRLAISFLFDKPSLGEQPPSKAIALRDLIERLQKPDFAIHSKTDFATLQANVLLLNDAVDDGSFVSAGTSSAPVGRSAKEAEATFNAEIDELADKLREIWRKINDAGLKLARTEAKGVIEWVQQRLLNSVRTRKKPKKSVFDLESRREHNSFLPKQQDFMKKFLQGEQDTEA